MNRELADGLATPGIDHIALDPCGVDGRRRAVIESLSIRGRADQHVFIGTLPLDHQVRVRRPRVRQSVSIRVGGPAFDHGGIA